MSDVIFVGNGRCYHTIDWYRSAKSVCKPRKVFLATDLIDSEGHTRLVNSSDNLIHLHNIDRLLLQRQSTFGNVWRNLVKLLFVPLQVSRLKRIMKARPGSVIHAHSMYYMFLCWAAGVSYIGTPQGSEVLVRPARSTLYRQFAVRALSGARHITVDSVEMQEGIRQMCNRTAILVQNGIDVSSIARIGTQSTSRTRIVSLRSFHPLYRIDEILAARSRAASKPPLTLLYPSWEEGYKKRLQEAFQTEDQDLGRLTRLEMYKVLAGSLLAVSIPEGDSSPRSVYEAIFCGCCVAVTYCRWIDSLPPCMKSRIVIVRLDDDQWLERAIEHARIITPNPYTPSRTALELLDQRKSMAKVAAACYW